MEVFKIGLTTPILYEIKPFPANESKTFKFNVFSGNQVTKNKLQILKTSNNMNIYEQTVESFIYEHTLPENSYVIANGLEYKARIMTGDNEDNWSEWSPWIVFKCIDRPTINIDTIEQGDTNNQTILFQSSYTQTYDEIQSYRYILYNEHQTMIQTFSAKIPENPDDLLEQEIAGLKNETKYYVEVITLSVLGMEGSSGLQEFTPVYITPKLSTAMKLENLADKAAIKITGNIKQLIFKIEDDKVPVYVNGEAINLDGQTMYLEDGFKIEDNFTLKLWLKNVVENKFNLKILNHESYIEIKYEDNKFHLYKLIKNTNIFYHIYTDEITFTDQNTIAVAVRQKDNYCDIIATIE